MRRPNYMYFYRKMMTGNNIWVIKHGLRLNLNMGPEKWASDKHALRVVGHDTFTSSHKSIVSLNPCLIFTIIQSVPSSVIHLMVYNNALPSNEALPG